MWKKAHKYLTTLFLQTQQKNKYIPTTIEEERKIG